MKPSCRFLFNHLGLLILQNLTQFFCQPISSLSSLSTLYTTNLSSTANTHFLHRRGTDHIENTYFCRDVLPCNCLANSRRAYCNSHMFTALLPSTGCPSLSRIVVRVTQQWAVYQECVFAGTCLSSHFLTMLWSNQLQYSLQFSKHPQAILLHTHIKRQVKLCGCVFQCLYF
jgi:hypothetical protein